MYCGNLLHTKKYYWYGHCDIIINIKSTMKKITKSTFNYNKKKFHEIYDVLVHAKSTTRPV